MTPALEPCPFCGGEAALVTAPCSVPIAYVFCECGANGADFSETDEGTDYAAKAIDAWNHRTHGEASEVGALRNKLRMIVSHATGGETSDIDLPTNEIAVRITQNANRIWEHAQQSALSDRSKQEEQP